MVMMRVSLWALLLSVIAATAHGQSSPNFPTYPAIPPTATQWNSYFSGKVDATNGTSTGQTLNSPTLNGVTYSGTQNFTGGGTLSGNWIGNPDFTAGVGVGGTLVGNVIHFNTQATYGNTITLSGSTVPTPMMDIQALWVGTSTRTDNTSIAAMVVGSAFDDINFTNNGGTRDEILVGSNYGGATFNGFRMGVMVQMNFNTASTVTNPNAGGTGFNSVVAVSANYGGTSSGYGVSNFGMGSFFGADPWTDCRAGATYLLQCVGEEIDGAVASGANAINFTLLQAVLTNDHATHGRNGDQGIAIVAQTGASAGLRNLFIVGSYGAQWPGDPHGYLGTLESSENGTAVALAGGWDLNQLTVSSSGCGAADTDGYIKCPVGGNFYWRNPGVQLLSTAAQIGYASVGDDSNGVSIDSAYSQMSTAAASITVGAGGSGFTTGDIACDIYGDCGVLTASSGVVTGVSSLVSTGWQTSPPSNPVAFTAMVRTGAQYGTGLTLNLGWTAKPQVRLGGSSTDVVLGSGAHLSALSATVGFAHLPFTNSTSGSGGIPTGTPANTNGPACVWNDVTFVLDCYSPSASAWKHVAFSANAG